MTESAAELTERSTLAELSTYGVEAEITQTLREIQEELAGQRRLPGIILRNGSEIAGVVSRDQLIGCLAQPFSLEPYLDEPIADFLENEAGQALCLPSDCTISRATREALSRTAKSAYEPVLIDFEDGRFGLLDIRSLIVAMAELERAAGSTETL